MQGTKAGKQAVGSHSQAYLGVRPYALYGIDAGAVYSIYPTYYILSRPTRL